MERAGKGFEPPVNPLARPVRRGTLVVSLDSEALKGLLAITRKRAMTPGQFLSGLVDKELKHQKNEEVLAPKFIPEDHRG